MYTKNLLFRHDNHLSNKEENYTQFHVKVESSPTTTS